MRQSLEEVISLQAQFTGENTPAMQRRGILVRDVIPKELNSFGPALKKVLGAFGEDARAEGRDGTGAKTRIPLARWFSPRKSPSAQQGWYLVYLFYDGAIGASLCLSHGSTSLQNGSYVERSDEEVSELMKWATRVVGSEFAGDSTVKQGVKLGTHSLARAYERTTLFSKFYARGKVPSDDVLLADLERFCQPLRALYRAQELGLAPGETHVDVAALQNDLHKFTSPLRKPSGQGPGLTAPLRKAVEMHAMQAAQRWLAARAFKAVDVSASDSCDFRASRDGHDWVVEVKGTTGGPNSILLTRNGVALHRMAYPRNILLVVHGIELDQSTARTSGGELLAFEPWHLDEERLSPLCFEYSLEITPNPA